MTKGQVIDQNQYTLYSKHIAIVESSASEMTKSQSEYWFSLWIIYRDDLWKSVTDSGKFTDWLGDFSVSRHGCSVQTFYTRMKAVKYWFSLGLPEDKVRLLLGSRSEVALQRDIEAWFEKDGELKEEVLSQIEAGHESPAEYLERVSQLGPSEARREVQRLTVKDEIFPLPDECLYDTKSGTLLFKLRHDNEGDGLKWIGTIRITGVSEDGVIFLPEQIARYIGKRMGLRL